MEKDIVSVLWRYTSQCWTRNQIGVGAHDQQNQWLFVKQNWEETSKYDLDLLAILNPEVENFAI